MPTRLLTLFLATIALLMQIFSDTVITAAWLEQIAIVLSLFGLLWGISYAASHLPDLRDTVKKPSLA